MSVNRYTATFAESIYQFPLKKILNLEFLFWAGFAVNRTLIFVNGTIDRD
jgi:hypothetical protein